MVQVAFGTMTAKTYLSQGATPALGLGDISIASLEGDSTIFGDGGSRYYAWLMGVLGGGLQFDINYSTYISISQADPKDPLLSLFYEISISTWLLAPESSAGAGLTPLAPKRSLFIRGDQIGETIEDDSLQNLILVFYRARDPNALNTQNRTPGARTFQPIENEVYYPGFSLNPQTAESGADAEFLVEGSADAADVSKYVISGRGSMSFFDLVNATTLQLQNITMRDAYVNVDPRTEARGGSLIRMANPSAKIIISGSVISNSSSPHNGGVIYQGAGNAVVTAATQFTQNKSGSDGGVFYITKTNADYLRVVIDIGNQTLFKNNLAAQNGGAMALNGDVFAQILNGSTFDTNTAGSLQREGLGGAIYMTGGASVTINSGGAAVEFKNNVHHILNDQNVIERVSNDIYVDDGYLALEALGANPIYLRGGLIVNAGVVEMKGSNGFHLGGVNEIKSGALNLLGGILYVENAQLNIRAAAVLTVGSPDQAEDAPNTRIELNNSNVLIENNESADIKIFNNTFQGISILIVRDSILTINDSIEFNANEVSNAGIISIIGSSNGKAQIIFNGENTSFINNTITNSMGGLLYWNGVNARVDFSQTNVTAQGNKVYGDNGGVFWYDAGFGDYDIVFNGRVDMKGNTIGKDSTSGRGGAFYINGSKVDFLAAANFNANKAGAAGGAFYAVGGANITFGTGDTDINSNSAGLGGGFYLQDSKVSFNGDIDFVKNTAAMQGGAVYMMGNSSLKFAHGVEFSNNIAGGNGGALYIGAGSLVEIRNGASFSENAAQGAKGGAIYNAGILTLDTGGGAITFSNNQALQGKHIYNAGVLNIITNEEDGGQIQNLENFYTDGNSVINKSGLGTFSVYGDTFISGIININEGAFSIVGDPALQPPTVATISNASIFSKDDSAFNINFVAGASGMNITFDNSLIEARINIVNTADFGLPMIVEGNTDFAGGFGDDNRLDTITKNGAGTWAVGNTVNFAGVINVTDGKLRFYGGGVDNAAVISTLNISGAANLEIASKQTLIKNLSMGKNTALIFDNNADLFLIDNSTIAGRVVLNVDTKNNTVGKIVLLSDLSDAKYAAVAIDGAVLDMSSLANAYASGYETSVEVVIATASFNLAQSSGAIIGTFTESSGEISRVGRVWKWKLVYDTTSLGGAESDGGTAGFKTFTDENGNIVTGIRLMAESQAQALDFPDLNYNQRQAERLLFNLLPRDSEHIIVIWDAAEDIARNDRGNFPLYLEELSGSFLATLLTIPALNINPDSFFENVRNDDVKIWTTVEGNFFQTDKKNVMGAFEVTGGQAVLGADILKSNNMKAGVFADVSNQTAVQGSANKANLEAFGGGVYGGIFDLFGNLLDIKMNLGYAVSNINATRGITVGLEETLESSVKVRVIKLLTELDLNSGLNLAGVNVDFFGRLNLVNASNDKLEEGYRQGDNAALIIDEDSYTRFETDLGIRFSKEVGRLNLGAKVYGGFLVSGQEHKYDMHFLSYSEGMAKIEIAPYSSLTLGADVFASYSIFYNLDLTADVKGALGLGKDEAYLQGGVGARWYFGREAPVKEAPKPKAVPVVRLVEQVKYMPPHGERVIETVQIVDHDEEKEEAAVEAAPVVPEAPAAEVEKARVVVPAAAPVVEQAVVAGAEPTPEFVQEIVEADEANDGVLVDMGGGVYTVTIAHFEFNKWNLSDTAKRVIAEEVVKLKGHYYTKLIIVGYADDIGTEQANAVVSLRRADAVFREFVKHGVDPDKIEYWGVGAQYPVAPNDTPNNRAKNRRATLTVER
ncbi:MAG: OmpA family protein [Elusimicrobiota bacterium]|nr:OmpA family protein [Elusimicrobiota bacterium]